MTNDDCWLLAVGVVECATAAMVVTDCGDSGHCRRQGRGVRGEGDTVEGGQGRKGKGEASKGKRVRVDEGALARAMVDMANDNGKQQELASDNGAARRHSSKINKIGMTIPTCFSMLVRTIS